MKKSILLVSLFLACISVQAQYWFGPKIGFNYIDHVYQESSYERDSFDVDKNWNFQAGVAVAYTATSRYSVYGEITYERIGKKVTDKLTGGQIVKTEMTNHFISIPVMLRVTLGKVPFHYYVNGGPRLSYWLGGNGTQNLDEFEEFLVDENGDPLTVNYRITFNSSQSNGRQQR